MRIMLAENVGHDTRGYWPFAADATWPYPELDSGTGAAKTRCELSFTFSETTYCLETRTISDIPLIFDTYPKLI